MHPMHDLIYSVMPLGLHLVFVSPLCLYTMFNILVGEHKQLLNKEIKDLELQSHLISCSRIYLEQKFKIYQHI